MINIKDFDSSLLKLDKTFFFLYLTVHEVDGFVEEKKRK